MKGGNSSRSTNSRRIRISWSEFGSVNRKRAAHLLFPQNSKTLVTDHQQLKKAICAVAVSSTHASQIVRWSS